MSVYINGVEQRNLDTPEEIRDALLSLADSERKFVVTDPGPGETFLHKYRVPCDGIKCLLEKRVKK